MAGHNKRTQMLRMRLQGLAIFQAICEADCRQKRSQFATNAKSAGKSRAGGPEGDKPKQPVL